MDAYWPLSAPSYSPAPAPVFAAPTYSPPHPSGSGGRFYTDRYDYYNSRGWESDVWDAPIGSSIQAPTNGYASRTYGQSPPAYNPRRTKNIVEENWYDDQYDDQEAPPQAPSAWGRPSTLPSAQVTTPVMGSAERFENGIVRFGDGTLHFPDGTVLQPDGTARYRDGTKVRRNPDGSLPLLFGAKFLPDKFGILLPKGLVRLANGEEVPLERASNYVAQPSRQVQPPPSPPRPPVPRSLSPPISPAMSPASPPAPARSPVMAPTMAPPSSGPSMTIPNLPLGTTVLPDGNLRLSNGVLATRLDDGSYQLPTPSNVNFRATSLTCVAPTPTGLPPVTRPTMGIEVKFLPDPATGQLRLTIHHAIPGGPTDRAGLRPGDVISSWDATPIDSELTFAGKVSNSMPNQTVLIGYIRNNQSLLTFVVLGASTITPIAAVPSPPTSPSPAETGRPTLGMSLQMATDPKGASVAVVFAVAPGGPADRAGVVVNDILAAWNGVPLNSQEAVMQKVRSAVPGNVVQLVVKRQNEIKTIPVTVGITAVAPAP